MKDKQNKQGKETEEIGNIQMVFLNPSISIFTLNINGPNSPLRVSFRVHEDLRF